jgi:hypothetical protein
MARRVLVDHIEEIEMYARIKCVALCRLGPHVIFGGADAVQLDINLVLDPLDFEVEECFVCLVVIRAVS